MSQEKFLHIFWINCFVSAGLGADGWWLVGEVKVGGAMVNWSKYFFSLMGLRPRDILVMMSAMMVLNF